MPSCFARARVAISILPEIKMIGILQALALSVSTKSRPLICGICTSRIRQSGCWADFLVSSKTNKSAPDLRALTAYPAKLSRMESESRTASSSSTIMIVLLLDSEISFPNAFRVEELFFGCQMKTGICSTTIATRTRFENKVKYLA